MKNETHSPSIFRVVQSDFLALVSLAFPAIMLGMYLVITYLGFFPGFRGHDPIRGAEGAPVFLYMSIVATIIGVPVFVWRFNSFRSTYAGGLEVTGQITNISFSRDRGRVDYSYDYSGQMYRGWNAIMKTKRTKAMATGDNVVLMVDKGNPKRALIRDLYI